MTRAGLCVASRDAVRDGQVQRHRAVATVDSLEVLHIVAALGVSLSVPGVAVTGGFRELVGDGVVDGQMQRDGTVAAIYGLEVLHIVTGDGVCLSVPGVAVASGFVHVREGNGIDCHGHARRTCAAVLVRARHGVGGRGGGTDSDGRTGVTSVPNIAVGT